jgi:hypothetical protein
LAAGLQTLDLAKLHEQRRRAAAERKAEDRKQNATEPTHEDPPCGTWEQLEPLSDWPGL